MAAWKQEGPSCTMGCTVVLDWMETLEISKMHVKVMSKVTMLDH